jgi:tRNA (mo5U34)-methyltransferase
MNESRRREIERLGPWFHNLHLPDGTETCPHHELGDFPAFKWKHIAPHLPERMDGWTALDVGCNAGFYSFELARRGARVTAIDSDEHYLDQARWAASEYGLAGRIDFRAMQVYELARAQRTWDLVLFLGVLYHLRYPALGLDIVSRCVGRLLVFQSLTMPSEAPPESVPDDLGLDERDQLARPGWPKMAFIERSLAGDGTNWWAPNAACVAALLRSSGLRILATPGHEIHLCEPDREGPTSMWPWNEPEYRAALGLPASDTPPAAPPDAAEKLPVA